MSIIFLWNLSTDLLPPMGDGERFKPAQMCTMCHHRNAKGDVILARSRNSFLQRAEAHREAPLGPPIAKLVGSRFPSRRAHERHLSPAAAIHPTLDIGKFITKNRCEFPKAKHATAIYKTSD
jgi:hypothetical protein